MNPMVQYVIEVVVLPAVVAAVVAAPFLFAPLRRRGWRVEAAVGSALALAFLLSFITELDARAVLRQFMTIEGDDAPFERWHRLGLVAAILIPVSCMLGALRRKSAAPRGKLGTLAYALPAAIASGVLVAFPGSSPLVQVGQGALVLASVFAWCFASQAVLWNAWVVFAVLAALAGLGGFASLAVMCGAVSAAACGMAIVAAMGARASLQIDPVQPGGAIAIVLGVLAALIARCGMAYDTTDVWPAAWVAAALLPLASVAFSKRARRAERVGAKTFWTWLGVAILAAALVGAVAAQQSMKHSSTGDSGGDEYSDMYGG